jgi:hypothetical protein
VTERPPASGTNLTPAEIAALDARWARCWTPAEVARRLAGVTAPWYVAAGWAIELFRGERTRPHHDIEIGVPAARFPEIRAAFPGYAFDAVGSGRTWADPSPEVLASVHQTWLRDPASGDYLLDVFREPHDGDTWICRRDETIRLPYADIIARTADGIPYLVPELALLFKAKSLLPKDQADFDAAVPRMTARQRDTLAGFLARVYPGHAWLSAL